MRQVNLTINISDSKFEQFIELMQQLGFVTNENDFHIPEEHKELVRNRIKTAKKEDYISWEEPQEDYGRAVEMKRILDERLLEDEKTYLSSENSIKQLNKKYGL
jgi:superfamily II helicase